MKKDNTIFVIGMGRSGTKWLKRLLNTADNARAFHEPDGGLHEHTRTAAFSDKESEEFVENQLIPNVRERKQRMNDGDIYVEVNSFLRNDWYNLKKYGKVVHHLRNPRKCITSMMKRNSVIDHSEDWQEITPESGEHARNWDDYNNFQKTCWYWWRTNRQLWDNIDFHTKLWDLNNDWHYVENKVRDKMGIDLDKDQWRDMKHEKVDSSEGGFPDPTDWDKSIFRQYMEIVGTLEADIYT